MRKNLKIFAITSALLVGSLGTLTLQAHPGSEGMKQEGSMMGQGMMGHGGMMEHMKKMEKMMENCNKMMQTMMEKMEKQQGEPQESTQTPAG
jgi:hypothetical protein